MFESRDFNKSIFIKYSIWYCPSIYIKIRSQKVKMKIGIRSRLEPRVLFFQFFKPEFSVFNASGVKYCVKRRAQRVETNKFGYFCRTLSISVIFRRKCQFLKTHPSTLFEKSIFGISKFRPQKWILQVKKRF